MMLASVIGVTSLIFNAKGNPVGQFLIVVFSACYGVISYKTEYYGEMITYLGMTAPMAVFALISWIKNPYKGNRAEVQVNRIRIKEMVLMFLGAALVMIAFYYILSAFNTANIILSMVSVLTSFIAVYLTYRRSIFFTLAYAANDVVLIALWILAVEENISYISVVICFIVFLINDIYGFMSWKDIQKRQEKIGA